jgi:hypothetical protein
MKTLIKVLAAIVVLNAAARGGAAAMHYYQLKQAAQDAVLFGADATPEQIQSQILKKATELRLPVAPENVVVERTGGLTRADTVYRETVEYFPGQKYSMGLSFAVEGYSMVLVPVSGN